MLAVPWPPLSIRSIHMSPKRVRRTYDEIIAALKQKVVSLEEKKRLKQMKADPSMKLAQKIARGLRKAEVTFQNAKRADLASAARAGYISLEGNLKNPARPGV
jgi:hypothetical protein